MKLASLLVALAACGRAAPPVREVSVEQLAALLAADRAEPIDANLETVRARQGTIPGATLLSDYAEYALGELPSDRARKLVFYCVDERCLASHEAAKKARDAGYRDVAVLPAGIKGWRAAGQPTQ